MNLTGKQGQNDRDHGHGYKDDDNNHDYNRASLMTPVVKQGMCNLRCFPMT